MASREKKWLRRKSGCASETIICFLVFFFFFFFLITRDIALVQAEWRNRWSHCYLLFPFVFRPHSPVGPCQMTAEKMSDSPFHDVPSSPHCPPQPLHRYGIPTSHEFFLLSLAISIHALGGREEERRLAKSRPRVLLTRTDLGVAKDRFSPEPRNGFALVIMTTSRNF